MFEAVQFDMAVFATEMGCLLQKIAVSCEDGGRTGGVIFAEIPMVDYC